MGRGGSHPRSAPLGVPVGPTRGGACLFVFLPLPGHRGVCGDTPGCPPHPGVPSPSRGAPAPAGTAVPSLCPWGRGDTAVGIRAPSPPLGRSQAPGHGVPAPGTGERVSPAPAPSHPPGSRPGAGSHPCRGVGGRGGQRCHGGVRGDPAGDARRLPPRGTLEAQPARRPQSGVLSLASSGVWAGGFGAREQPLNSPSSRGGRSRGASGGSSRRALPGGAGGGGREKLIIQEAESRREAKESSSAAPIKRRTDGRTDGLGPRAPRPRPRLQAAEQPRVGPDVRGARQAGTELCPHPDVRAASYALIWMCRHPDVQGSSPAHIQPCMPPDVHPSGH